MNAITPAAPGSRAAPSARRRARGALPRTWAVACTALALLVPGGHALAFEELNPAQTLVYDTPHLASTATGDVLEYRYVATPEGAPAGAPPVTDRVSLSVTGAPDEERRDVTLDFLTDGRHLALPPFEGYRGNPVLIAMLEHLAQSMSASAGGGALYFRNRIRDAFAAEGATIEEGEASFDGQRVPTRTLSFRPFVDDPFLGARPGYGGATFVLTLSEAVPGGVLAIEAHSAETPGAARFDYALRLDDGADGGADAAAPPTTSSVDAPVGDAQGNDDR